MKIIYPWALDFTDKRKGPIYFLILPTAASLKGDGYYQITNTFQLVYVCVFIRIYKNTYIIFFTSSNREDIRIQGRVSYYHTLPNSESQSEE